MCCAPHRALPCCFRAAYRPSTLLLRWTGRERCAASLAATSCCAANGRGGKAGQALRQSAHGRILLQGGFDDDITVCAQLDRFEVAPRLLRDGDHPRLVVAGAAL